MESQLIDLVTPLKNLQANAEGRCSPLTGQRSDFVEGYLMAIDHALELAKLQDWARGGSTELAEVQQEGK